MNNTTQILKCNDCLVSLKEIENDTIDLIYLDPPFFTQKTQVLSSRKENKLFSFQDSWKSSKQYASFLYERIFEMHRVLKSTGSIFIHCDNNASHMIRFILDEIFGDNNFQSKIIWTYKRWTNTKKGLTPAYQEILFYSKTNSFKFNKIFTDYSPTTNLDQILQKRSRDNRNKSVYAKVDGKVISSGDKQGVPLSDVWNIPYLNPKAAERVGYPTQKPLLLLEQIIKLCTEENDLVLDPFCGSGTTIVASKLLNRNAIGIDSSEEAIELAKHRLENPIKTKSALLEKGEDSYINKNNPIFQYFSEESILPVQRNLGIDGMLKKEQDGKKVFIKIQRKDESISTAASKMLKAAESKGNCICILLKTQKDEIQKPISDKVLLLESPDLQLSQLLGLEQNNQIKLKAKQIRFDNSITAILE
ncbi:TPA: site-specific DNA-methyltransferase [Legionella pneumophila]|uniref:DNA-methyltransferase n=1 Tax=Legionella pneumophila TaxID=446 RepID=UPI00064669D4|nr:site-specific DNA-methyltransferase [Legionella pneumophila]HAT9118317.1 site-specific DNA-methyltransferase [Legionella pneumophila subsp. pneumophila]MCH9094754.1 site-specific DNA-methyltransferase [Legionella pneumophila serogroup 1]MCH9136543.1 site-specific DNA-methyltransferase [Legionella pneumophila serogroup 1]MCH9139527.1 site-specific DNA-methyltransferase [Legionella pneumophila serogroup 1]MCH9166639.1 site-specific DNA-methyltransferase [Legionella pneumophila serogroup 1]